MKFINAFAVFLLMILICSCNESKDFTQFVDPFIGTGGHGHTYPGAQTPFGMVQLSPDTRNDESWDGCSGYHYSDSSIIGFSHTHLSGTGVSDYGDVLLMPIAGKVKLNSGTSEDPDAGYRSRFSHKTEFSEPGYYTVFLEDYQVKAELTAGDRVGYHRYTFTNEGEISLLLDLIHRDPVIDAEIQIIGKNRIAGKRRSKYWAGDQQLFFAIEFSKPFKTFMLYNNKLEEPYLEHVKGKLLQSVVSFNVEKAEKLEVKVAISTVSVEGAIRNLDQESKNIDFDQARKLAKKCWNNKLGKIEVEGGSLEDKRNFYTALYHSLLTPNLSQDVDGNYRGMDGAVHQARDFTNYTVFSLWDTFRALHPLLTIIEPGKSADFIKCLVQKSKQFGELPMWELASNDTRCMIGYHAVSLIADAHAKGIDNFDLEEAFVEMKRTALLDKRGLKAYRTLGFVPSNKSSQAVSKTLEYAYDDWCIAQIAKALKKEDDYYYFMNRASNYQNIYDPSVGFMRGKNDDHTWVKNFDPTAVGNNYTEGNSFQYSLFVPHDIAGITNLLGGKKELENWLDRLFTTKMEHELEDNTDVSGLIGQYAHGNEPSHHMAYLYNYADKPWKTQAMVRKIMKTQYQDNPDGLCGNEDCGQMSAWYVLSAMGFYSDCPGSSNYSLGSPLFNKVILHIDDEKDFVITANNNSEGSEYIQSIKLNGAVSKSCFLPHAEIVGGGELTLEMGKEPNKDWVIQNPNLKREYNNSPMVYLTESSDIFIEKFFIDIKCDDPNAKIYYTLDGTIPNRESKNFKLPFFICESADLKMRSYKDGCEAGFVVGRELRKQEPLPLVRSNLISGLSYSYYEGIYRSVYDFEKDVAVKKGVVSTPTLNICSRKEWIGLEFGGFIEIPSTGEYTFYMSANDGCQMLIDGEEQFESDGRKSDTFGQQSTLLLSKGFHRINLKFYQSSDNIHLSVEWKGPRFARQIIPSTAFYYI